jgi:hypothetical protein
MSVVQDGGVSVQKGTAHSMVMLFGVPLETALVPVATQFKA